MKGVLRLEIEKHQIDHADMENISETGSVTNDTVDPVDRISETAYGKLPSNGSDGISGNGSNSQRHQDYNANDVSITLLCLLISFLFLKS